VVLMDRNLPFTDIYPLIKREIIKKGYSSYSFAEAEDDKIRMLQSDINL
jgi:hypothetical protein